MNQKHRPVKRLFRSRYNKRLAGVCGGLGGYFNIDPVFIRILFIALFFAGGAAFFLYIAIWLLVPLEPLKTPWQ